MNDTLRYILAGGLIFLIIILQPVYLEWLGYNTSPSSNDNIEVVESENLRVSVPQNSTQPSFKANSTEFSTNDHSKESYITIVTPLYTATLTNKSGGSL